MKRLAALAATEVGPYTFWLTIGVVLALVGGVLLNLRLITEVEYWLIAAFIFMLVALGPNTTAPSQTAERGQEPTRE